MFALPATTAPPVGSGDGFDCALTLFRQHKVAKISIVKIAMCLETEF
jgi:hypothetical protein